MKVRLLSLCLFLFAALALSAQEGYRITVKIEGYDQPILSLANNLMDKQYIKDTARVNDRGEFVFASDTAELEPGIYLVVLAPNNDYFQVLVGHNEDQEFSLSTKVGDLGTVKVKSSDDNALFYDYLGYLDRQQQRSVPFREQLADTTKSEAVREAMQAKLEAIGEEVTAYQDKLVKQHPESYVAAIIRTNAPNPPPEFPEIEDLDARNAAKLAWLQEHYFDKIDLKDQRLLRTPFLFSRIEYYVDKLFVPHPDTISMAIDRVLDRMDPESEMFRQYVVHFTNRAASSNIVGMDAVYVHMVDNYYATGRAYWAEGESLKKMVDNANTIRPLLIGKKAPNIRMKRRDGTPVELYGVDAKYTVLYFWKYDCGSCKKSTPVMAEFYEKWKDKGVEIFSVCTKQNEIDKCWEYVDEKNIGDWLHATDRYMRFYKEYDVRSTPTIFVLDENKEIVSKRIGAQQLDELLTALEAISTCSLRSAACSSSPLLSWPFASTVTSTPTPGGGCCCRCCVTSWRCSL